MYNLFMKLVELLIKLLPTRPVYAHCDIPCGIYDPYLAQMAAYTVLRMTKLIQDAESKHDKAQFVRLVQVKEEHAELCKKEVLILWTDYFNLKHLGKFPDLHDLIWKTTKLCSGNKRAVDEVKAQELVEAVDRVADIFNQTKR